MSPKAPKAHKEKEDAEVTCPVCAGIVTLDDPFCPHCGAEFEEEEVEEVVEEEISSVDMPEPSESEEIELSPEPESLEIAEAKLEEEPEPAPFEAPAEPAEEPFEVPPIEEPVAEEAPAEVETEAEEQYVEVEEEPAACLPPKVEEKKIEIDNDLTDLRIVGFALLLIGIIGSVVMINIKWFWLWTPSIEQNMLAYGLLGIIVIVVAFILYKKMSSDVAKKGKAPFHPMVPSIMLALILFGFISVIMFILAVPINQALKSSNIGMSVVFIALVVVGIIIYLYGAKAKNKVAVETS